MEIAVLIPLACWLILFTAIYKRGFYWRESFLSACVICGVVVIAVTETLSFFNAFSFAWIVICWILATTVASFYYLIIPKYNKAKPSITIPSYLYIALVGTAGIVIITGFIAIIAPPNTWDSMTYHMSRVMHWIQNRTVAHYPTAIQRQLYFPPLAEFVIAHLQIISTGDRFANLVQWFSMVGSLAGVSLIARELGADEKGQIYAAAFAVTIPMGILQSSSTQNDYVVSFWLVCFVYYILIFKKVANYWSALAIGASLGLAVMTKGTAYVYAIPFLLWFIVSTIKVIPSKNIIKYCSVITIIFLALNGCHYLRNYMNFGYILLNRGEINDIFSFNALLSNISLNLALHAATPFPAVNVAVISVIEWFHKIIGVNINYFLKEIDAFMILRPHEDIAGNPVHLILIVLFFSYVFMRPKFRHSPNMMPYSIAALSSFVLFCFFVRWMPFNSRLHLPFFVVCAPAIGNIFGRISYRRTVQTIIVSLLTFSVPFVFLNDSRPILNTGNFISLVKQNVRNQQSTKVLAGTDSILKVSRISQYFNNHPPFEEKYEKIADFINNHECSNIGIQIDEDSWEYPIWILLKRNNKKNLRIEHVNVKNISSRIKLEKFMPCIIIKEYGGMIFLQKANHFYVFP